MDTVNLARFMNPRQLELIILPTEHCNFRCTYCYEDYELGQMSDATVEAIKIFLAQRIPQLKRLNISWFGGEPLMAKSVVFEICRYARAACQEHGVEFISEMTTNAFGMDEDTFDQLVKAGVTTYQVSIDGDEEEHNQTRKLISGRGTFERIWRNLLAARDQADPFLIVLRVHVHLANIDSVRGLLPKMAEAFAGDARYIVSLKAVGNLGGEGVKQIGLLNRKASTIDELNQSLADLGWPVARIRGMADASGAKPAVSPCYAAKPNSFVIRADASLAKCTVAFGDVRNSIGRLNEDGTLTISDEKMRAFMNGFQTLDEKALHCPMSAMPKQPAVQVIKVEKKFCGDKRPDTANRAEAAN